MNLPSISPQTVRVSLSPTPGWCIKSQALQSAVCRVASLPSALPATTSSTSATLLEPISKPAEPSTITIPQGMKVFVNLAWDQNVPPPPEGSEEVIQKAMRAEEEWVDEDNPVWFVPVVVSEPRPDIDKAGKPSIVFDCVFHTSIKSRAARDVAFKTFLEELAFQRIEDQSGFPLSRTVGRPNIRSKGKLNPRTVLIPIQLYPADHPERVQFEKAAKQRGPLVQEISNGKEKDIEQKRKKGILKTSTTGGAKVESLVPEENELPNFNWVLEDEKVVLRVDVPRATRAEIVSSTLDVEPSRLILSVPPFYFLDLNIDLPDAQMPVAYGQLGIDVSRLKRTVKEKRSGPGLDVKGAKAEWRAAEGVLVVTV